MTNNKFKAEPYLCVAASLQYVIYQSTGKYIHQYEIADYFGVCYPDNHPIENVKNYSYSEDSSLWGIQIKKNGINQFFNDFLLPLKEEYYPINTFTEYSFETFINEKLKNKISIICGYSKSTLYKSLKISSEIGHASIIKNIDVSKSIIEIFDIDPSNYGKQIVDSYDLFVAIHRKHDGLWLIKS